jgi:integrase
VPVYKDASGRWYYKHDLPRGPNGKRRQKVKRGFKTKKLAVDALEISVYEAKLGIGADPERITLAKYMVRFLNARKGAVADTTHTSMAWAINHWIAPHLGQLKLAQLEPDHLDKFYRTLRDSHLAENTQHLVHQVLRQIFRRGAKRRELRHDLLLGVDTAKKTGREYTVLTPEQQILLIDGLKDGFMEVKLPVQLLLTTGMRVGEVAALKWIDLNLAEDKITLRKETTKTKRGRTITLFPETTEALKRHREDLLDYAPFITKWDAEGPVFPRWDGGPWKVTTLSSAIVRKAGKIEGVPRIRTHDLRHTHASDLLAAGVPVTTVSARLGHSSPKITLEVYAHAIPGEEDLAAKLGAARLQAARSKIQGETQKVGIYRVK